MFKTRFRISAKRLQGGFDAFAKRFDFLELPDPLPADSTLNRYRKEAPPHFDFCIPFPKALAPFKTGPELKKAVISTRKLVSSLRARIVRIATPTSFTPSQANVERLEKLVGALNMDASTIVWEPSGLWEIPHAGYVASSLGIVLSVDPLHDPIPPGDICYLRFRALGESRRKPSDDVIAKVIRAVGNRREAFVVVENDDALSVAKSIRRSSQGGVRVIGGFDRLIRPSREGRSEEEE